MIKLENDFDNSFRKFGKLAHFMDKAVSNMNNGYYEQRKPCRFCGDDYQSAIDNQGCPVCCDRAINEWVSNKNRIDVILAV